ncbi:MAG: type II secretion system F family protein [Kiritimatiellae bacterium]|nr:type II secretion system F family protein [Kiritimatiellia bacterium]
MKTYDYKGFSQSGQAVKGLVEALDLKDARERLAGRGVLAEWVYPAGSRGGRWLGRRRAVFSLDTRSMLYREVGALLKAGLPLANALEVLIAAPETGAGRNQLAGVRDRIREGSSLAAALEKASAGVTPFELAAVEVGERSGDLGGALDRLASFMEEQQRLQERVQTALVYPVIVLCLALLIAFVMLGVMLPRFADLMAETRIELPVLTRWTLAAGRVFSAAAVPALLAAGGAAYYLRRRGRDAAFRARLEERLLRLPLWGRAHIALINLRFARTLALLLRGGVGLLDAMLLAGKATGSVAVENLVRTEAEAVRHGTSLADALRRIPALAGSLPSWVQAGEASGDLAGLLENAARRYQQQWDRTTTRALAVLEPVLVLLVGGLVLLLALSILLPVLSLNRAIT